MGLKFIVRDGFVIHDSKLVEVAGRMQEQSNTYYEGQTVDFDEATALEHAHKLAPADKASTAWLEKTFPSIPEAQAAAGVGNEGGVQIAALTKQVSELTALVAQLAGVVHAAVGGGDPAATEQAAG